MTKKETNLSDTLSEAVSVATSVAYTRQEIQKLKTEFVSLLEKKTTEVIVEQVPGPVGPRGALGATGTQGSKGDKGDKGDVGERGEKGDVGQQGEIGPEGLAGIKGDKGDKGDIGEVGPQGEQGIQGVAGERGEKGDRGTDGKNGLDGRDGKTGAVGPAGPIGETGLQGGQGPKGDKGDRGRDGQQGIQGSVGPRGEVGPQGIQGVSGKDGKDGDIKPVEEKFQKFIDNVQKDVNAFKTKVNAVIIKSGGQHGGSTGSGEVNLRYLDDVDRDSITDGYVLSYDEASKKFVFVEGGAGGGTIDTIARTRATNAWNTANLAYTQANNAFSTANASYTQANTGTALAQAAYNYANTIVVPSLSGYAVNTNVNLVWSTANNAYGQANSALDLANSAFAKANTGGAAGTDNLARSIANSAFSTANSAFAKANTGTSQLVNGANTVSLSANGTVIFPEGYLKIVPNGANPYISNRIDNGFGLVSGSAIQIRQSVADAYGISINSSTTDTCLGDGSLLASGSNIDVNGSKIILGQYSVNNLDADNGLTGQNKIEINNSEILIGLNLSTLSSGTTTSAFGGWTFNGQAGTLTFPDATIQNTAFTTATTNAISNTVSTVWNTANSALSIAQSAFAQANTGGGGNAATDSLNIVFNNNNAASYKVVAVNANSETILASTLDATQANKVVGILNANTQTVTLGTLTNPSWTWTPDQTLYLGSNGEIVTSSTIDGAQFSLKVGYALSATKVFVKIGTPVVL